MGTNIAPEGESQEPEQPVAPPQPSPWESWQQAGWNPQEVNPYEARQAYEGWQALGNRDTRDYMLERMLQGNELPEGMSWQEAREAIQSYHQQRQDPFAQYQDYGQGGYEDGPSQQDYADAAAQGIDPYALRQAWQQDMQQQLSQFQQQFIQQQEEQRAVEEFTRTMDTVKGQYGLSDADMQFLAPRAAEYAQNGQAIPQAVEQAYRDFDDWRRSALASAGQQQQQAPQNFASQGGFAASPEQPPQSLAEARDFMLNQTRR